MKKLLSVFVENSVLANSLLIMVLIAGLLAALTMIREEMPNVAFDYIDISVVFPGADPEAVEEGISRKIEEAIQGMEGIKSYTTFSQENLSLTNIQIMDAYDGRELLDRVRSKIDEISTFPSDAEKPVITLPLHADPVMALYLNGGMPEKDLKAWAYRIRDQLLRLEDVSQIVISGTREYEIGIEVTEQKLREYGITFSQVADAVRQNNLSRSGGLIKNSSREIRVRTLGRKYTGDELSSIVVLAGRNGDLITLDKLAEINDGLSEGSLKATVNGDPAIILTIYKTDMEDTIHMADAVKHFIDEKRMTLPPGSEIGILFDNSDSIKQQVAVLIKNGIIGLITVFIILWLFLSSRLSLWTGVGIIVSIFGGLAITWMAGGTINMVSIFGFIMILGIVADDAIVVGESIAWHRKMGEGPIESAMNGFMEVGKPVSAAVLTTVIAFIPFYFIGGVMGKFISILPTVVIACLAVSLLECFMLLPSHLSHLPDPQKKRRASNSLLRKLSSVSNGAERLLEIINRTIYTPLLHMVLRWRYAFFCLTLGILLISLGLVMGGLVKFEMLPERDGNYMTARVEFPDGTSSAITMAAVDQMEKSMLQLAGKLNTRTGDPLIENIYAVTGKGIGVEPGQDGPAGSNHGGVRVMLLDFEKRGIPCEEILSLWKKDVGIIYGARSISFTGTSMGHPGKPIEIAVDGRDMNELTQAVDDLKNQLDRFEGVFDIQSSYAPGKDEIRFSLRPEARTMGITVRDLADQVYAGYYGEEALRIQRGRDSIKIKVRYTQRERQQIASLGQFRIRTPLGDEAPIYRVADVSYGPGFSQIVRTNGLRRIMVSADVDSSVIYANEITSELSAGYFTQLRTQYPGIRIDLEGDAGESEESFDTMITGFMIAILGIYLFVATLFRSYIQPLLIMFTIPFGMIGAIWGHYLLGWDLTMISLFGMIGLAGIVINDAIVLVDRINGNLTKGMAFKDAILAGGQRRFRAVFLTSLSTVGGLTPLIFETNPYATSVIPMAITVVFGVIFATVLTLLLMPSLYFILNDFRMILYRLARSKWQTREDVEPARYRKGILHNTLNTHCAHSAHNAQRAISEPGQ